MTLYHRRKGDKKNRHEGAEIIPVTNNGLVDRIRASSGPRDATKSLQVLRGDWQNLPRVKFRQDDGTI